MLTDLITQKRIQCIERVSDWREAIRTASAPLLEDGSIQESYVDAMVESVETVGPYIVLAPELPFPHARPGGGGRAAGYGASTYAGASVFRRYKICQPFLCISQF